MFCFVIISQDLVVDIDRSKHANLAEVQQLVVQANQYIAEAQKRQQLRHERSCRKARQLLLEVNRELKAAADAASEAKK